MAIEPKTTREHIVSLYGHISGVKRIKNSSYAQRYSRIGWQDRQNLLGSFSCGGDRSHTFTRKIYNLNPVSQLFAHNF